MSYKRLVGVMIPTRNRVPLLHACLDSLNLKTSNPSLVELLVKVDEDDTDTIRFVQSYTSAIPMKVVTSPRNNGYGSLHEYYNSLAEVSEAEFLMLFNDDVEMVTQGWEQKLVPYSGTNFVLAVRNERIRNGVRSPIFENYNANPIIPRDLYTALGTLSHHPMLDDWWVLVARAIREQNFEIERWLDITLLFKRPDGVETDLQADTTFLEGRQHINWKHRHSNELNDYINNLIAYMNRCPHKFLPQR